MSPEMSGVDQNVIKSNFSDEISNVLILAYVYTYDYVDT